MDFSSSAGMLLIFAWTATGLLALLEGLFLARTSRREDARREAARERVRRHATRLNKRDQRDAGSILLDAAERGPILTYLTSLIPDRRPLDLWLYRAGAPMQLEAFAGMTVALALMGLSFGILLTGDPVYAFFFLLIGFLPTLHVRRLKKKRMHAFEQELPNAVDLLGRSLRAGHPLPTGLQIMAEESAEPVATEISQVVDEIELGLDPRIALQNLRGRIGTPDTSYFVNAVLIQRETGGDLPRVLESLAKQTRQRLGFHTRVEALVAQTSLSANVLVCFPFLFALLMSIAVPGYLDPMFASEGGRQALMTALGFTIFGWWLCRRVAIVRV